MRLLLLVPPGERRYCRDYYLGGIRPEESLPPPQDLACLSGTLDGAGELRVLDAQAEGLGFEEALERACRPAPDFVFFLISAASYMEDARFLAALDERLPKARFAGMGDVYREIREMAFSLHPFLDAVLYDFTSPSARKLVEGGEPLEDLSYRRGGRVVRGAARKAWGAWDAPAPRWDLFPLKAYGWPLAGPGPRAALLGSFGCPFLCSYCPASALGFRTRPASAVIEEARALERLGARSVLFRDQTFGADPAWTRELLERWRSAGLGLSWSCATRVDLVDAPLLGAMKEAGCASVSFGVDSGDDEVLRAYKKNATRAQAREAVRLAREAGLRVAGEFVLGFAMDTRETVEATLAFARELALDHASFRVEAQRYAADYRREMLVRGLVPPEAMPPDTPTSISVWQGRLGLSNQDAFKFEALALGGEGREAGLKT